MSEESERAAFESQFITCPKCGLSSSWTDYSSTHPQGKKITTKCFNCGHVYTPEKKGEGSPGKKGTEGNTVRVPHSASRHRVVNAVRKPGESYVLESAECPACGKHVDEGWECTMCRRVYCDSCGGESVSSARITSQNSGMGNCMVLDLSQPDKGPPCGKCNRELKKWRGPDEIASTQTPDAKTSAGRVKLGDVLKSVPWWRLGKKGLLKRLHRRLQSMRKVSINDWYSYKGKKYGPREPFDPGGDYFESSEAVLARLAPPPENDWVSTYKSLKKITFNTDSCILEFDSVYKRYALLRTSDNQYYWWNIWQD